MPLQDQKKKKLMKNTRKNRNLCRFKFNREVDWHSHVVEQKKL